MILFKLNSALVLTAILLICFCGTGCGSGKTAKISGKVIYNGQPVPGGLVTFFPLEGEGQPASASIREDGTYALSNAPVGQVRVTVNNLALKRAERPPIGMDGTNVTYGNGPREAMLRAKEGKSIPQREALRPNGNYVAIPTLFSDVKTTSIVFSVEKGGGDHDIELR